MTELKTPTAVLHEGPRSLSDAETAEIERRDLPKSAKSTSTTSSSTSTTA